MREGESEGCEVPDVRYVTSGARATAAPTEPISPVPPPQPLVEEARTSTTRQAVGIFLSLPQETKGSVAVRVALGETQLVQEVRRFLLDNGVCLDSFSQVGPRCP